MSDLPNIYLLLKRIGTYLAKAEAKGSKEKRELKMAREALKKICEIFYGKIVKRCDAEHPQTINPDS